MSPRMSRPFLSAEIVMLTKRAYFLNFRTIKNNLNKYTLHIILSIFRKVNRRNEHRLNHLILSSS